MGKATMQSKFVPVNLNKSYGQEISISASSSASSSSSSASSSFGPVTVHKARPHGGMVLLTRPSSSSLSTHRTPKFGTPCLVNFHKENARSPLGVALIGASGSSVWSRQRTPITSRSTAAISHTSPPAISPDSTLGSRLSHAKQNTLLTSRSVDDKLPLMPRVYESNASTCTSPLAICNKHDPNRETHKHAEQIAVLREEDFPSLQINCLLCSLHAQQIQSDMQQKQKVQFLGQDQQKKLLRSSQQQIHFCEPGAQLLMQHHLRIHSQPAQPFETTMPINEPSTFANDEVYSMSLDEGKSRKSVATPNESWADDEREIMCQGSTIDEFPSHQNKGLWRRAWDVKDQACKWESQFEFEIRAKDCSLIPECLSRQFSLSKDRVPLTYDNVADFGNKKEVLFKSNALDSNHTEDNTWNLDKLRRSLCASAKGRCLQGVASGSYLQQILEHQMLGSAKPDFSMESFLDLDLKARRRKKEEAGAEFKDLARESFEAELERVEQMLEQERLLVFDGQEEASKLVKKEEGSKVARKEHEDQKRLLIEKELHLELKEETKKTAESCERKSWEVAKRAFSAREEERKKMLEEEEKRKERAFKKLLELEERIARREAEQSLMANGKLHSSASDCEQEVAQPELSVPCNSSPIQEQLHRPMDEIEVTNLFYVNKDSLESSGMSGCMTAGQKLASPSTLCSFQNMDIASAASQQLPEEVQVSSPSRKLEALRVDSLVTPLYLEDKDSLAGIKISDDNNGKEIPESIEIGACSSMTDVPHGIQIFEKPQVVVTNVETKACEDLKRILQDVESGELVVKYLVQKEEFQKPFRQVLPDMIKKASEATNIDLNFCFQETREELVVHQAVQQPSLFLLHANQAAEVMQQDAFSSRQFSVQGLPQPFAIVPVSLSKSSSHAPANDLQNQHEAFFQPPLGLHSSAPFMLHAIQIGSIQMPLTNTNSCMPQLLPLHGSQDSLLQFGQLYSASSDQLLSTVQLTLPVNYIAGQVPEHHEIEAEACVQQGAKLIENWDQMLKSAEESPVLSGNGQIQFGQLFSTVLYKPLPTDPSFSFLVQANEKLPQLQVQAESLCLQGLASNSLEKCNPLLNSAEESLVPSSSCQLLCHNASMLRYGYNDCALAPERNQANVMGQEGKKTHFQSNDNFPAVQMCPTEKTFSFPSHYKLYLSGRKKRGHAATCARVLERRYWRVSTLKTKYVEVSHSMPEKIMPGLGDHNRPLHRNVSRFVYRKKERPGNNEQHEYQIDQQPAQTLCSAPLQNQEFEKAGAGQSEIAVSMCKNNDTNCDLLCTRMLKRQQSAEDMPMEYGVVCVFEQQGIETPCTVDDFIEVKSRRQILRKQRKEEEIKSKSKNFRAAAQQQRVLVCSSTKGSMEPSRSRMI